MWKVKVKDTIDILFFVRAYGIAYRRKGERIFHTIFPNNRYMYADPFVFEYQGKTAIFVELMDYYYGWGTIGVFEINDGTISGVREIIRENNHMSFPNVFMHNGQVYMMPETYSDHNIHMYRCIDFPYKWERMDPLIENVHMVDHAVWEDGNDTYVISYDLDQNKSRCFLLDWTKQRLEEFFPEGDYCRERPGGTFYVYKNELKRVIQDCHDFYGDFIKIYRVKELNKNRFNEVLGKTIKVNQLKFDKKNRFDHIHQYSVSDYYEVIDFNYNRFYWNKLFRFLYRFICHPERRGRYFC